MLDCSREVLNPPLKILPRSREILTSSAKSQVVPAKSCAPENNPKLPFLSYLCDLCRPALKNYFDSPSQNYYLKNMSTHIPHFPIATLTYNAQLIIAAAAANPEIAPRLPANYISATSTALGKVTADIASQKTAQGELGNLTPRSTPNLDTLQHWMNQARKTAKLAFPGQTVKLHQEFQVGITSPYDLGSVLSRADIIHRLHANRQPARAQLKGWTDAETARFHHRAANFRDGDAAQQTDKGGAKDSTTTKNTDAADLYERLLTIQNAADLQWPVDRPRQRRNARPIPFEHISARQHHRSGDTVNADRDTASVKSNCLSSSISREEAKLFDVRIEEDKTE